MRVNYVIVFKDEDDANGFIDFASGSPDREPCTTDPEITTWTFEPFSPPVDGAVGVMARASPQRSQPPVASTAPFWPIDLLNEASAVLVREGRAVMILAHNTPRANPGDTPWLIEDETLAPLVQLAVERFREVAPRLNDD